MEIKEFVKETISEISDAINELNHEKSNIGLIVAPSKIGFYGRSCSRYDDNRTIEYIEFNLSVTVSDKNETGGGIMISIAKAGINNESTNSSTSTIKFTIPVVYPCEK